MPLPENLPGFFPDFGVPASAGSYSTMVNKDAPDELVGGHMETRRYSIMYPANALGPLAYGSMIVVDGVQYRVKEVFDIDDGALQRAHLEIP